MAEIQDTLMSRPKLSKYQSRPVSQKDPGQSRALNIHAVEAEMMNSVTKSFETIWKINNDTKIAARDLEKNDIGAQIADHYRKQETYVLENINKFKDQELDTETFFKKYDDGELEIKEFEYGKGHTDQSKDEMEAIKKNAEGQSRGKIRQMLHQELVRRTGDMLDNKANKSINLLRNDLVERELEFPEGFAKKFLVNGKNQDANDYMKRYIDVLDDKVYGDMMDEHEKKRRIYEYGQKLGNVLFEHYATIDQETAVDFARKRKFIVGGIPLDSAIVGKYVLNQEEKRKSEVEASKRLKYKVDLKEIWTKNPEHFINQYSTQEERMIDGKLVKLNIFKETPQRIWEALGPKNGFQYISNFDSVIKDAVLRAEGKHKQAVKEEKIEKERQDRKSYDAIKIGVGEFIKADSKDTRDTFLHRHFVISDKERPALAGKTGVQVIGKRWVPTLEYAGKLAKTYNVDVKEVYKDLQNMVNGIPVRIPGSGMGPRKFSTFQSAVVDYYTKKLFVSEDGVMAENPIENPDLYETGLMNDKEKEIYANIKNGFEDIINFNTNNFTSKSSDTLLKEAGELVKSNTNLSTGQTSLAFATAWKRYSGGILAIRVKKLILTPNQLALQDLKIDHGPPYNDNELEKIQGWWDTNGQNRSKFKKSGGGYVLFDESLIENIDSKVMSLRELRKLSDAQKLKTARERR